MLFRKHPLRWALLALVLVWPLLRFTNMAATWLDYPYPRPGTEGLVLYESMLLKQGDNIYAPITPDRFISAPYPPAHYWLTSALLPNTLPDLTKPGKVPSILQSGRVVSLLSALIAAALLPLLIILEGNYRSRKRRNLRLAALGGTIGGVLFLYLPPVLVWATRLGGELPTLALTAAGLVCIAAGTRAVQGLGIERAQLKTDLVFSPQSLAFLIVGAALFALALFTRMWIGGPLAAAIYLILRNWRIGLAWCGVMTLMFAVPFVALDTATAHGLYLHLFDYHPLLPDRATLGSLLAAFWEDHWPLLLLAGSYAFYRLNQLRLAWRTPSAQQVPLLLPIFTLVSLVTMPFGVSLGVEHSRLLLPGLAICASTGALLATLLARANYTDVPFILDKRTAPKMIAPAVAVLLVIYVAVTSWPSSWYNSDLTPLSSSQKDQIRKIALNLKLDPGKVYFSDEPGLLALAGKQTPFDDTVSMTVMSQQGRWDESTYRSMLRGGKFSLLLLPCDASATLNTATAERPICPPSRFTPGVLEAIPSGYKVLFWDIFSTYAPK